MFSAPMVRAILAGTKTQTRRLVKDAGDHILFWRRGEEDPRRWVACDGLPIGYVYCPYGEPGDRLWVRETWYYDGVDTRRVAPDDRDLRLLEYRADHDCRGWEAGCPCNDENGRSCWRPSIHMPRWASRLTLEVTAVRVERLQDIREPDACAEGLGSPITRDCKVPKFARLWDEINGKRARWDSNPWVWVVSFKKLEAANG